MTECFICREKAIIWTGDFTYEDYNLDGNGIVHECYCANCGARVVYYEDVPDEQEVQEVQEDDGQSDKIREGTSETILREQSD